MGKYEGYLICSDFDGTVYYDGKITRENLEAIEYFQAEGGYFTFASGRNYEIFTEGEASLIKPNAPLLTYNGALIISPDGKRIFHQGEISRERALLAFSVPDRTSGIKSIDVNTLVRSARYEFNENDSPEARLAFLNSFSSPYIKMLARMDDVDNDATYASVRRLLSSDFNVTRSWTFGIEFNDPNDSKGRAAQWLKGELGCHTLVCVGDYDNDIDMIEAADIGYAVENATDSLKAVADRITVHVNDSAIARIISELS